MIYTLPCGKQTLKYPDMTERELLLEHVTKTQCNICQKVYLQGERIKRSMYEHVANACVLDNSQHTEQLCNT